MSNGPETAVTGILGDRSTRLDSDQTLQYSVQTATALQSTIGSTLGPAGLDKLLLDNDGYTVTNDGRSILEHLDVTNPIGELVVDLATNQREELGDGTKTAILYTTALVREAEALVRDGVHPNDIVRGFEIASNRATETLNELGRAVELGSELVRAAIETSLTGTFADFTRDPLAELIQNAIECTATNGNANRDDVSVATVLEGPISESRLVRGAVVDKKPVHPGMPTEFEEASVLVLGSKETLEVDEDRIGSVVASSGGQYQNLLDYDRKRRDHKARRIDALDPDVIVVHRGIDDELAQVLANENVLAFRGFGSPRPVTFLAESVGAEVVTHLDEATESSLGSGSVAPLSGTDRFVVEADQSRRATVLLVGWTEYMCDEIERSVAGGLTTAAEMVDDGAVLPGGGAPEVAIAAHLRQTAPGVPGREQLAVEAFADAVEIVPRLLAANGGGRSIDVLTELRAAHDRGEHAAGVDDRNPGIDNMYDRGIVDPGRTKTRALKRATETATQILRVDGIFGADGL